MNTDPSFTALLNNPDVLLTWGVALLLLVLGLAFVWPGVKSWFLERRLQRCIRSLATDSLHQVVISDGVEGAVFIENLLFGANGLLLLPVHRYRGALFAADNMDNWTQVVGKRTYKFANPLHQLEQDVIALRNYVPDIPVEGRVLCLRGVDFPKGRPAALLSLDEVQNLREHYAAQELPPAYQNAWEAFKQRLAEPETTGLRRDYAIEREAHFTSQTGLGLLLLGLAAIWLLWRCVPG